MAAEALIFAFVTLGLLVSFHLLAGCLNRDAAAVRRRLAEEFTSSPSSTKQQALFKNLDQLSLDAEIEDYSGLERFRSQAVAPWKNWRGALAGWLEQGELLVSVERFLLFCLLLGGLIGLAVGLVGGFLAGGIACLAAAICPTFYVFHRRAARREKFLQQLPNAFDLMARVIRAGQSVSQALTNVADSFDRPLAHEFAQCLHQQNFGLRPEVAFQEMAQRWEIIELRIFVMAMLIQRQTGGNLSEVLERLAALIRARLRLRQQVRTLTAEGRLQGWTLFVLPLLMLGMLAFLNRGYVQVLFEHPALLVGTGALMLLGLAWIRRIVNVEI